MEMNDFLMCSFNLSLQIPAYMVILATIVALLKWVQLSMTVNRYELSEAGSKAQFIMKGISFGVLILAAIYKCINTCPEILVTTGFD